jgi:hypothetical protein
VGVVVVAAVGVVATALPSSAIPIRRDVPVEFVAACGHPGKHVRILRHHYVIRHRACDLRGVVVENPGVGVVIPWQPMGVYGNSYGRFGEWRIYATGGGRYDVTIDSGHSDL